MCLLQTQLFNSWSSISDLHGVQICDLHGWTRSMEGGTTLDGTYGGGVLEPVHIYIQQYEYVNKCLHENQTNKCIYIFLSLYLSIYLYWSWLALQHQLILWICHSLWLHRMHMVGHTNKDVKDVKAYGGLKHNIYKNMKLCWCAHASICPQPPYCKQCAGSSMWREDYHRACKCL